MKLWEKGIHINKRIEDFTIGIDRELDIRLAAYDILGSVAHAIMLESIGLLSRDELAAIRRELKCLYNTVLEGKFSIEEGVEDVHSQVELTLTRSLGDTGRKIHTARSRNDQVLLDIKMYVREEVENLVNLTMKLFNTLIQNSEKHKHLLMPGYTHMQVAMPSSFGLWYGAFAESLTDDMQLLLAAYRIADQNPLGSAAGYGSSFPVNRQMTTALLGFSQMNYNVVYAQMGRGKTERIVAWAMSSLAGTISKLANDICLFTGQNFGFFKLPDEITTGSSIMPHKKNPDVFELVRARCNKIQALPGEIDHILLNLPTGYFRDLQVIKESFLPAFTDLKNCMEVIEFSLKVIEPAQGILEDERYKYIFTVEEVNKLVLKGVPFREAYQLVAAQLKEGTYNPERSVHHLHEGSSGNLCHDEIRQKMNRIMKQFDFEAKRKALTGLFEER